MIDIYTDILCALRRDLTMAFSPSTVIDHDVQVLRERAKVGGLQFLTVELPLIGKALDKSLDSLTPFDMSVETFGLFADLFQAVLGEDGKLLGNPHIGSISALRQLTMYFYKLEVPYPAVVNDKVVNDFVDTDRELALSFWSSRDPVIKRARALISSVLAFPDSQDMWMDIKPSHGPGAVSTGHRGFAKFNQLRFNETLNAVYPFDEYFTTGINQVCDDYRKWNTGGQTVKHGTAKVVLVPKDSRGPRLISCEPVENQWIQQGIAKLLVAHLESHRFTRGFLNFTNQEINRDMALQSSLSQEYVTLDMKEASDRVSLRLVKELFKGSRLLRSILACRSKDTLLPSGERVYLNKFAPMGSALCFPIEAFVFWALAVASIQLHNGLSLKRIPHVYVYGDDIIVKSSDYQVVQLHLERFSLLFNRDKCCVSGFFRESCGMDAYKGIPITPTRLRKPIIKRPLPSQYTRLLDVANAHSEKHHYQTYEVFEKLLHNLYGRVHYGNSGLNHPINSAIVMNRLQGIRMRFNRKTYALQALGYATISRKQRVPANGWNCGLSYLCSGKVRSRGDYVAVEPIGLRRSWVDID